ncbi:hypothetical protein VCR17J2_70043 [Vibrio coralliirubri]|nr:hypothetical protein VCR17J2_70043 [Vibrio coralliirubri]
MIGSLCIDNAACRHCSRRHDKDVYGYEPISRSYRSHHYDKLGARRCEVVLGDEVRLTLHDC